CHCGAGAGLSSSFAAAAVSFWAGVPVPPIRIPKMAAITAMRTAPIPKLPVDLFDSAMGRSVQSNECVHPFESNDSILGVDPATVHRRARGSSSPPAPGATAEMPAQVVAL